MIDRFEVGHWYRFTGILGKDVTEQKIDTYWDYYGESSVMCAVLDGKARQCGIVDTNASSDFASFLDFKDPKQIWCWAYGFEFWEEVFVCGELKNGIKEILNED